MSCELQARNEVMALPLVAAGAPELPGTSVLSLFRGQAVHSKAR